MNKINFLNFKNLILKNITNQPDTIKNLIKKLDKIKDFTSNNITKINPYRLFVY